MNRSDGNYFALKYRSTTDESFKTKRIDMSKLDKTISEMVGNGHSEITIRQGDALPVDNLKNIVIIGNIDAPSRFVDARDVEKKTSYCYYSVSQGVIELIVNELEPYGRYKIEGHLKISKKFKDLAINTGETFLPFELAQKLKLMRSIFPNRLEHANICSTLRNFEADVKRTLEEKNDDSGSYNYSRQQAVDSNIPASFQLNIPLIEGEPSFTVIVTTVVNVSGNDINCSLESVEAAEIIEDAFEKRVTEEVEKLKEHTTLIAR